VRVAAIDLGTNTTRLLVADVDDGTLDELHRETRITRLGEGVDTRKRLLPVPIARVRNTLTDYRRIAEQLGAERMLAVGTSAIRDAENGEAFLGEIEWSYGFATHVATGDEEAALTRRGVSPAPGALVVDLGGGSTELVLDDFHVSLDVGAVRFTERYGDDVERIDAATKELLPELEPESAVGVAGTLTTLAALDLQLERYDRARVHAHRLTRDAARAQRDRLASLSVDERKALPAMEPQRAPVILAGAAILVAVLDRYALDAIEVSERDILDGIAFVAATLPETPEGEVPPGAFTCC
jgi:exopolyphosphatase/guanosine-5'-triphosphate,3'-diphosphate pyrophosphatase